MMGIDPNDKQAIAQFYQDNPTPDSFMMKYGGMVEEYKKGGWIQKATASIKKRGTEGVCTGSNFGGPSCRPGTKRYALAKTFRKMAKARKKEEGGYVDMYEDGGKLPEGVLRSRLEAHMSPAEAQDYINNYEEGGVVDVYQLMGMPTPSMYGMGGYAMGGQVNCPECYEKNITFAMGGNTEMTEGELEKGEVLNVYRNGSWTPATYYDSTGMGRHNADGSPKPEQVVPLPVKGPTVGAASITSRRFRKLEDLANESNDALLKEALHGKVFKDGGKVPGKIEWAKMRKENKQNQEAVTAYNKFAKKYGGTIQRMYADGGMVPMYQPGGLTGNSTVIMGQGLSNNIRNFMDPNSFYLTGPLNTGVPSQPIGSNILQNVQPSAGLTQLLQSQASQPTPAARPYNSNVGLGAGLSQNIQNFVNPSQPTPANRPYNSNVTMGQGLYNTASTFNNPNNFYQTGPNYTVNPGTTGTPSVQSMIQGLQPSPFLQRVTRGVQPSPFLQRVTGQPTVAPTPSTATNAGNFQPTRPVYTPPTQANTNRSATTQTGTRRLSTSTRSAASAAPRNTEEMTMMRPLGFPSTIPFDNFDLGNIPESERMYETVPSGPMTRELTADELYGPSPSSMGGREMSGSEVWGTADANPGSSWMQRKLGNTGQPGSGQGMNNALMAAQFLPAAYNLGRGIFEKPWKPGSYETPADLKWNELTGAAGQRQFDRARAGMEYAARNIGGSNALAALTQGANNYYGQLAKYNEDLENINRQGQSQMDVRNKAIQQSNMQMRMQRDYLAQQAREKKAEMIGAGISNIGSGAGQLWQNRQMMDALRMAYPQGQANMYNPYASTASPSKYKFKDFSNTRLNLDYSKPSGFGG